MANPEGHKPPWTDTGKQTLLVCLLACVSREGDLLEAGPGALSS